MTNIIYLTKVWVQKEERIGRQKGERGEKAHFHPDVNESCHRIGPLIICLGMPTSSLNHWKARTDISQRVILMWMFKTIHHVHIDVRCYRSCSPFSSMTKQQLSMVVYTVLTMKPSDALTSLICWYISCISLCTGQKAFYRLPKTRDDLYNMTRFLVLHDIEQDPYEKTNQANSNPHIVQELLSRLREHCRRREPYVPVVEREESHPKFHHDLYQPWLTDGDDLEWHELQSDRHRFEKYFIEVWQRVLWKMNS